MQLEQMLPLYQIVYQSTANQPFSCQELGQLLTYARTNNEKHNITGLLLYNGNEFLQVLEGECQELKRVYERVEADPRHGQIRLLSNGPIDQPTFPDWRMGFVGDCANFFEQVQGYVNLNSPGLLATTAPGAVPMLLALLADFAQEPYAENMPV